MVSMQSEWCERRGGRLTATIYACRGRTEHQFMYACSRRGVFERAATDSMLHVGDDGEGEA
jgi:hypothetical protein